MNMNFITRTITAVALVAGMAAGAQAGSNGFSNRVEARDTTNYTIRACGTGKWVGIEGDGDTDLDFHVTVAGTNRTIFRDYDETDFTAFFLPANANGSCRAYNLRIINRGDVYNRFQFEEVWA